MICAALISLIGILKVLPLSERDTESLLYIYRNTWTVFTQCLKKKKKKSNTKAALILNMGAKTTMFCVGAYPVYQIFLSVI